jgi:hypothetical protein
MRKGFSPLIYYLRPIKEEGRKQKKPDFGDFEKTLFYRTNSYIESTEGVIFKTN